VIHAALTHPWVRHLRLRFNVLLTPIYLWGAWLAPAEPEAWRLLLGWLALHVFLYGGTTAFNSYYDRDEGPVGGLRHPQPVDAGLLPWSLLVQALGAPLAWFVSPAFFVTYLLLGLLAAAYSHPWTRWKSSPSAALCVVALGQGGVGALAGAWAALGPGAPVGAVLAAGWVWWGVAVAALVLLGQYIVSQAYQVDEDRRRGDRTLPVMLGARAALRWGLVPAAAGVLALLLSVALQVGWGWASIGAALGASLAWGQWRWSAWVGTRGLDADFAAAMRLVAAGGIGLSVYLLALIVAA